MSKAQAKKRLAKSLGRLPRRSDPRALLFSRFAGVALDKPPPKRTNFWPHRAGFTHETWGNNEEGCCTIAKQANMFRRFERLEQKRTIAIATSEVHRVYREMTGELYGGGDTGAYETDALDRSRRPEKSLRDTKGHPLLIDAYVRLHTADQDELRHAIHTAGGHGIAVCLNLPEGFSPINPPDDWDVPQGEPLVGQWMAGSWGGHSMWGIDYDEVGLWLEHTWGIPPQRITWKAVAAFLDEAHLVIDSANSWKKRLKPKVLDVAGIVAAVNRVSSQPILA